MAVPCFSSRYAVADGGSRDCGFHRAGCHEDFAALAATTDPAVRAALRDRSIEVRLDLAYGIASRYSHTGSSGRPSPASPVAARRRGDARRGHSRSRVTTGGSGGHEALPRTRRADEKGRNPMAKLAFIGLGLMGTPMATRLVELATI